MFNAVKVAKSAPHLFDRALSLRQAAQALAISERTLARLIAAGKVNAVRVSDRRRIIAESEIERIINGGIR
jgi:excisionase family DNA binding protein